MENNLVKKSSSGALAIGCTTGVEWSAELTDHTLLCVTVHTPQYVNRGWRSVRGGHGSIVPGKSIDVWTRATVLQLTLSRGWRVGEGFRRERNAGRHERDLVKARRTAHLQWSSCEFASHHVD